MRKTGSVITLFMFVFVISFTTGCWNYREIENLAIVTGMAIDKGKNSKYHITMEIASTESQGKNSTMNSKIVEEEGETIFDTLRNIIKVAGKRLYFSHIKVVILSQDVARENTEEVLDWFNRDAESMSTISLVVSSEKTAKELLTQQSITSPIRSMEMDTMLRNQKSLSKAPNIKLHDFINRFAGEGISGILPRIGITEIEGKKTSEIGGAAIFKRDKFADFLDDEETKYLLFILNEIRGGVITNRHVPGSKESNISLEIFKNTTKIETSYSKGQPRVRILVNVEVALAEQGTPKNYATSKGMEFVRESTSTMMEDKINSLVKKVQEQYGSDIFGFGKKFENDNPKLWDKIKGNWEEEFRKIEVSSKVNIDIRNTGVAIRPIKAGD